MASIKDTNEALKILSNYNGNNPYILSLRRDILFSKVAITDFQIEYILKNHNFVPRQINKIVKIANWLGLKKQETWKTEFVPQKLKIVSLIGETKTTYCCYVQYRQSVPPTLTFLPKNGVLKNFLVDEDYHNVNVDFERYDKLS